ncbi:MAG: alkaline phosphatase family protein [Candidatus Bipolaricaulaceae bacterium]
MRRAQAILDQISTETGGRRPHYERYALPAVPATIEQLFGADRPAGLAGELGLPPADKVVSFVLDGVGYRRLLALEAAGAVDLSPFGDSLIPLTSVFPPTTTTALASLATGASPIVHGVLGYRLFLQQPGAVVNMIKLAAPGGGGDSLEREGVNPEEFLPVPTVYQRLAEAGVDTVLFLPRYIVGSGLSRILYQGVAETVAYVSPADLFFLLQGEMARPGRRLLAVYWPTTDTLAHLYGPRSRPFELELSGFFRLLAAELLERVSGAVVLVTADHGFQEIDPQQDVIVCPQHRELKEGLLCPPVGDNRAAYLFVRRGHEDRVRGFFRRNFPHDFQVLSVDEALDRKLWGLEPAGHEARARLGDMVAVARGRKLILWPRDEFKLRGMHGGMTEEELLVPLLTAVV